MNLSICRAPDHTASLYTHRQPAKMSQDICKSPHGRVRIIWSNSHAHAFDFRAALRSEQSGTLTTLAASGRGSEPHHLPHAMANVNLNFRVDESPEVLLKELALSPLIYVRLAGIVSRQIVTQRRVCMNCKVVCVGLVGQKCWSKTYRLSCKRVWCS